VSELPKISVIIPVRNEEKFIAKTLEYLQMQDYPRNNVEFLVVDGESDDTTAKIVRSLVREDSRIKLLNNPKRLSSAGKNVGIKNAFGDIITFIDGHSYIDNDQLLVNTARLMKEEHVSVLSRPQFLDTPYNSYRQNAISLARKSLIGHGTDSTIYSNKDARVNPSSSGASYKREVFNEIGLFDERFDACEDVEFNYRAHLENFDSFTSMKLAVYYFPRETIRGLFRQLSRYGTGRFRLARKHPRSISIGTLIPPSITVGLPLLGLLSFWWKEAFYLFIVSAGLYAFLLLGWSAAISIRKGIKYLPILPLIFLVIHFGLGYGFLAEMIRTLAGKGIKFD